MTYASQSLRMPPGTLREFGFVVGVAPGRPTGRGLMRCENDTWLFTAMGMAGHEPPNDLAGMCAFAEAFAPAHALAAVRAAQPMGEVARHRLASSQWRQYDKMRRFPTAYWSSATRISDSVVAWGQPHRPGCCPREQMALSLGFHIVLACFGVAIPTMIFLMHRRGIVGDDPTALRLARRWANVSALLFAIGAIGLRTMSRTSRLLPKCHVPQFHRASMATRRDPLTGPRQPVSGGPASRDTVPDLSQYIWGSTRTKDGDGDGQKGHCLPAR